MSFLENPEIRASLSALLEAAQDAVRRPEPQSETALMISAVEFVTAALSVAAQRTDTRFDDIAVNTLRYSGVLQALIVELTRDDTE